METNPNQKTITTKGAEHANTKTGKYGLFNINAMQEAMTLLKPNTFKLWCYMAKNQNNYTFALSCVDACGFCKMTKKTYLSCVQELIDTGYLINTNGNHYDFYEKLPKVEEIQVTVKKSDEEFTF